MSARVIAGHLRELADMILLHPELADMPDPVQTAEDMMQMLDAEPYDD